MKSAALLDRAGSYMNRLCREIPTRQVGSEGNRQATAFFAETIASSGWSTETHGFDAVDWEEQGASLQVDGAGFEVFPSPYSLGVSAEAPLAGVSSLDELEQADLTGKIVLLHGEIAGEQIMPKNFVFYNPEGHQRIIALLERGHPAALVCATGRNASLAGGVYPFPLFEDGDFDIPSVFMTDVEGARLLPRLGRVARLQSTARRIPGKGFNVNARMGGESGGRVVVTAHIDAKKGTPGALDNASGVVILLLLAELLRDYRGERQVEIVAFNGEDYYAVPGQMLFVVQNQGRMGEIALNINIDGAGYLEGKSAFSFYGLPADVERRTREILLDFEGITEGPQWYQGDHSIFVQSGCPAIAVSSLWFSDNIDSQEITHTEKDRPEIVDCAKLVEIARALERIVRG